MEQIVIPYTPTAKQEWNSFLQSAKNTTFLFNRDYMDYHSDRFADCSLMVLRNGTLHSLLPANRVDATTVATHQGLTYGGLILQQAASLRQTLASFQVVLKHLHENGVDCLLYKSFPSFYNTLPSGEIDYALFQLGAELYRRDSSIVVALADRLALSKGRKHQINKGRRLGLRLQQDVDFSAFWKQVLEPRLKKRYGVTPVHSLDEINLLAHRFPENIKQFSAYYEDRLLAGITIYETSTVAHAQYIAVTDEGQEMAALDYLCGWLLDERYRDKRFFDFGNCCENEGRTLNEGLLLWKESFGGRTICQDFYRIETARHAALADIAKDPGRL